MLKPDSYVRHSSGDWKVLELQEKVKVWRIGPSGQIEENFFPEDSLTAISSDDATWFDPAESSPDAGVINDVASESAIGNGPIFIGHTRFSLFNPNSTTWKASNGSRFRDVEEYKSHLYSSERLALRTEIFVKQSLPQLQEASRGFNFRHIISYSESLPAEYQEELRRAAIQYPFVVLDRHHEGKQAIDQIELAKSLVASIGDDPSQPFGLFRLDDDDLLPKSFFQQNAPYLQPEYVGKQVSLAEGFTALYIDGAYYHARECYWPMIAIGLMSVCQFGPDGCLRGPKIASHNKSDRTNPVILDSRGIGFLWARHADQDTSLGMNTQGKDDLLQMVRADMSRFPSARSVETILREFPVLSGSIFLESGPGMTRRVLSTSPKNIDGQGFTVNFPAHNGSFEFAAELECGTGTIRGNALVSFKLVSNSGSLVDDPDTVQALRQSGISLSTNPRIGFYRYLSTAPGRRTYRFTVSLPDGIACEGITMRRWKRPETKIEVGPVSIASI